jgi:hypothetical protein
MWTTLIKWFKSSREKTMSEENSNQVEESIPKEDSQIIDYITEREMFYESESRSKILKEVEDKFGDKGKEVLSQLSEDLSVVPEDLECEECGKMAKELTLESNEKIKIIEAAFDNELDFVVNDIYEHNNRPKYLVTDELIKGCITKFLNYKIDEIPEELIRKVMTKYLFDGIRKGWLIDELYIK